MIALIFLSTLILESFTFILFKISSKKLDSDVATFGFQLCGALFLLPILINRPFQSTIDMNALLLALVSSLFYAIGGVAMLYAFKVGKASTLAPISNLKILLIFILGVVLLHESVGVLKIIATSLIIYGLFTLKKSENKHFTVRSLFSDSSVVIYLGFLLITSFAKIIDKYIALEFDKYYYTFLVYFLPSVFVFFYILARGRIGKIKQLISRNILWIALTGLVAVARFLLIQEMLKSVEVSVLIPLLSISTLFSILLGYFLLKEKLEIRLLSVFVILIGAVMLNF